MYRVSRLIHSALCSTLSLSVFAGCDGAEKTPTDAVSTAKWKLVEDLRIGGAEEGPASFSDVHSMIATSDGSIFVLETKDQEVRVFDRDGKFLRRAARRGKGPGEIEYGTGLAISRDTVWVSDPRNGRFSSYNAAGDHIAQVTIVTNGHGDVWRGVADDSYAARECAGRADRRLGVWDH